MRIERLAPTVSSRLAVLDIGAPLKAAAVSLSNPGIGLVVVSDEDGKAVGVLSKSDLIRHLIDGDPEGVPVGALMSKKIISCTPDDEVHTVWETMVARRLQNMPVFAPDRKPLGILDIRDAMRALFEQEEFQERMLANYIAGIGYQ